MVEGVATSATLMVPCPYAREAAEMFAGMDIGVHLTLTSEYPGYRWGSLTGRASLHDDDGYFPRTTAAAIKRMEAQDVRAECRAQIDRALGWGSTSPTSTRTCTPSRRGQTCSMSISISPWNTVCHCG